MGVPLSKGKNKKEVTSERVSFRVSERSERSDRSTDEHDYPTDAKTILDHFRDIVDLKVVMAHDGGLALMQKIADDAKTRECLDFWHYCAQFPVKFSATPESELVAELSEVILKAKNSPRITERLASSCRQEFDVIELQISSQNLNPEMLEKVKDELWNQMVDREFAEFRNSSAARDFVAYHLSLDDVIDDDHALVYFEKYLLSEFSIESLNFYEDVNLYRRLWKPENTSKNVSMAKHLLKMFIIQGSPLQVNIPDRMRSVVEKQLKTTVATEDVFLKSQIETLRLMDRDGWARYRKSDLFQKYLNSKRLIFPTEDRVDESECVGTRHPMYLGSKMVAKSTEISKNFRRSKLMRFIGDVDIHEMLKSSIGQECFEHFLSIDDSGDKTVEFYRQNMMFETFMDQTLEQVEAASKMAKKFIDKEGQWNAAIDDDTKAAINQAISEGNLKGSMFDGAIDKVLGALYEKGVFAEFKASALYVKYRVFLKE